MSDCLDYTISEVTDRFLMRAGIDQKKYFGRYLVLAQECWEDIFRNTLWVVKSVWLPTKAGVPYNYIDRPSDCLKVLSVGTVDKCGLIKPLFYNNELNVIPKPTSKKCDCSCPDCGGLCEGVHSTTTVTKFMFTIGTVDYYQKCWIKYCDNGDIIEYCETPAIKYNSLNGTGGDYNEDFNDDYLKGRPGFGDFTIEWLITQNRICHLETRPCGCPVESEENSRLFFECCGFYCNAGCFNKRKHCYQYSDNVNNNHYGEVKMSECGTKIYYKPSRHWKTVTDKEFPDFFLLNYQTTGESVGSETLIPRYARNVMYAYLDCGRKEFNSAYNELEKQSAYYKKIAARNEVIGELNPINLIMLAQVQDEPIRW